MALANQVTALVASGTSLSAAISLGSKTLTGIVMPAAWTTANLTFQVSVDGSTFNEMYDASNNEVTVDAAAGEYLAIDQTLWRGISLIKIRSGTSGSGVTQSADRSLICLTI